MLALKRGGIYQYSDLGSDLTSALGSGTATCLLLVLLLIFVCASAALNNHLLLLVGSALCMLAQLFLFHCNGNWDYRLWVKESKSSSLLIVFPPSLSGDGDIFNRASSNVLDGFGMLESLIL